MTEHTALIRAAPWTATRPPQRILAVRFQAYGDIVATLPYLQSLRRHIPNGQLDYLTRLDYRETPEHLGIFDHIFTLRGRRNRRIQQLHARMILPRLRSRQYDVVIDLQCNTVSRMLRRRLAAKAWSEFDLFSPIPHGERVLRTIRAAWPVQIGLDCDFKRNDPDLGLNLLDKDVVSRELVVLNPAGYFKSRNWPLERYIEFAGIWLNERNPDARFLLLGLPRLAEKAAVIQSALPDHVINLTGLTTAAEAFNILQRVSLVLSEDSGLMHMAWVSGIPTVALIGSSPAEWTRPLGKYSASLDSSDLPCGHCRLANCAYGDVRCLTRYSARQVFDLAASIHDRFQASKHRKGVAGNE